MAGPLAAQRQALVLERLRTEGAVRVSDLTQALGVSQMTVRRDIDDLVRRGLARKVHGGASSLASPAHEPAFEAKSGANAEAKRAIARAAAKLVGPGQAIAISGGSTTVWMADELGPRAQADRLTIVTNSIPAAERLDRAGASAQCLLTGGARTPSQALVGPLAEDAIGSLRFDWFFLGVHGMAEKAGFTTPNVAEAAANRAFLAAAAATCVLADSSKWDVAALARIAPLGAASHLYSDRALPAAAARAIRRTTQLTLVEET
ncbi:MAG: DeoR/GlpR family DNA-binding transcription regulator [Bifidobacteriaceae bacterium]|nr:DeoR/GlpR family DNA-binding transcription regulator [Bifidobacteriaceae bacterium]